MEGTIDPDFWPVARTLKSLSPSNGIGGAAACVYHRGRPVIDLWAGTKDEKGTPWTADTVSLSYSTTKGVASTLLHIQADATPFPRYPWRERTRLRSELLA